MADWVQLPAMPSIAPASPSCVEADPLGRLLGALASRPGVVPKYRYPSAGTLYPVQAYLVLRDGEFGLGPGTYYHDPDEHALVPVSPACSAAPDGSAAAILLVLVARGAAIAPIYGDLAEAFSLLEVGYMHQALCDAGAALVLRDAGDPAADTTVRDACRLDDTDQPLVCWAIGHRA